MIGSKRAGKMEKDERRGAPSFFSRFLRKEAGPDRSQRGGDSDSLSRIKVFRGKGGYA